MELNPISNIFSNKRERKLTDFIYLYQPKLTNICFFFFFFVCFWSLILTFHHWEQTQIQWNSKRDSETWEAFLKKKRKKSKPYCSDRHPQLHWTMSPWRPVHTVCFSAAYWAMTGLLGFFFLSLLEKQEYLLILVIGHSERPLVFIANWITFCPLMKPRTRIDPKEDRKNSNIENSEDGEHEHQHQTDKEKDEEGLVLRL